MCILALGVHCLCERKRRLPPNSQWQDRRSTARASDDSASRFSLVEPVAECQEARKRIRSARRDPCGLCPRRGDSQDARQGRRGGQGAAIRLALLTPHFLNKARNLWRRRMDHSPDCWPLFNQGFGSLCSSLRRQHFGRNFAVGWAQNWAQRGPAPYREQCQASHGFGAPRKYN